MSISLDVFLLRYFIIYNIVYESYARSPIDEVNMRPKEMGDFRERVERETIRGYDIHFLA